MTIAPFDTLKFVETLTDSDMSEKQAKTILSAFLQATGTKPPTTFDIRAVTNGIKNDIREFELRMTIKLYSGVAVVIAATAAIVKL